MNNKGKTIVLICISILVVIGVIFVIYRELNVKKIYIPEDVEKIEEGKEIPQTDERILGAYKKIYKKTLDGKRIDDNFNIYRDTKASFNNIDDLYVYLAITSNMSETDVKSMTLVDSNTETYIIDLNAFNSKLKSLYGDVKYTLARRLDETELKVVNGLGYSCNTITKDTIQCDTKSEKVEPKDRIYGYIDKVEESDNYIYIYEKEIYIENTGDNTFSSVNIYTGVDSLLSTGTNIKNEIEKLNKSEMTEEELVKEIESKYPNLTTYKHTFMKTETNDTYWVSTEPVK